LFDFIAKMHLPQKEQLADCLQRLNPCLCLFFANLFELGLNLLNQTRYYKSN